MYSEQRTKREIQKIIYNFKSNYDKNKQLNEATIESRFIQPLFKLLGWTEHDYERQVRANRGDKRGQVDYAYKIDDRIVFFLEVKKIGIPLEKEADRQVVSYALSRRIPFAVSTNFKEMKIFCVEYATDNKFRVFERPEDYITKFNNFVLLSKDSFKNNTILKEAQLEGKLRKRITIDKPLLDDLMYIRNLISNDIEKNYPKKYDINVKDEIIQRILDRLIFIRRCEDTGINPDNVVLYELTHMPEDKAYHRLKQIFELYNEKYNGGLFKPAYDNECDKITVSGSIIRKLTSHLYDSKDKKYTYNFLWIDADVLGQVYEQYLGKILAQTKSGKSKLRDGQAHRKEQGIYYTPTYVVDYIVKNTVGAYLKGKHARTTKTIKILDPACGSGSFLIKAFDYLYGNLSTKKESKQRKFDSQGIHSIKTDILKNNLYGVDLDNKAIEITKLNLLLKAAEKYRKLPKELDYHIKCGNSLIDDEQIARLCVFKWEDDFEKESFDVVIGNPPYYNLQTIKNKEESLFFQKTYSSYRGKADILYLFIEKAMRILKEDGYLGFIVANYFLQSHYADKLRSLISENFYIVKIIDFGSIKLFQDANVDTSILILKKSKYKNKKIMYGLLKNEQKINEFLNNTYNKKTMTNNDFLILFDNQSNKNSLPWQFGKRNISDTMPLREYCIIGKGSATGKDDIFVVDKHLVKQYKLEQELIEPLVEDSSINRYNFRISSKVLIRTKRGTKLDNYPNIKRYLEGYKTDLKKRYAVKKEGLKWFEIVRYNEDLFSKEIKEQIYAYYRSTHNKFAYSNQRYVTLTATFVLTLKQNQTADLRYLLGILNSNFVQDYTKKNAKKMGNCFEYSSNFIGSIPIKIGSLDEQRLIIECVDKMFFLNKKLNEFGDKITSETTKMKEELQKTDDKINKLVYAIYGLNKKEIKIIEDSFKSK